MSARYEPSSCKRTARIGEKVRFVHGITNSGLGSGETVYAAGFLGHDGQVVEIPRTARLRRFWRNYTVKREKNGNHNPNAEFPVALVQEPFSEILTFLNSKGQAIYERGFPQRAGFRVVP